MPSISKKGTSMPSSPIRKLVPFAEQAERNGNKVYYLNIGQPDIQTPVEAQQAIKEADVPVLAYSHSAGFASLREGLSNYYHVKNLPVNTDEIIVTTGGSEALLFTFGSAMDEGDEIIIQNPSMPTTMALLQRAELKSCRSKPVLKMVLPCRLWNCLSRPSPKERKAFSFVTRAIQPGTCTARKS